LIPGLHGPHNVSHAAGVAKDYRQHGIASFLLENLIAHLTSSDCQVTILLEQFFLSGSRHLRLSFLILSD
jgi:hypothetical protein